MKAMIATRYGGPEVIEPREMPVPVPGRGEVLVWVRAAGVTTADWRLRAAAFPGGLALVGRLVSGLFRPRNPVLGGDFSGEVAALGAGVSEFTKGENVYGFSGTGAHAEYLVMKAGGGIARVPVGLDVADAAALPFGMLAAWQFLTKFAGLKHGERVLVIGGSGGVGVYAIQIARWLGARVTAVASASNHDLMRRLGAETVIDYRTTDPLSGAPWDVIFDTVGATRWRQARRALGPRGRYVALNFGVGDVLPSLLSRLGGRRFVIGVNEDRKEDLAALAPALEAGDVRPVIDRRFAFDAIGEAHALVETRHRKGAVVLDIAGPPAEAAT